ncbi:MAG: class I SAM-dependent RNA methyltransferase [Flavobacteriales bacterium]|nr:class I SAM-dependent RNA methyltransferase [Flavobacteriales bacterium]
MKLVAKTLYSLEEVLKTEVERLGGKNIVVGNRVVTFEGNKRLLYESNLWLRTAISVLVPVESFRFKNEEDLKRKFANINFKKYMKLNNTFAVKGAVHSSTMKHSKYPMLLLKDAVVNHFEEAYGQRPSVDLEQPHILFDLHISEQECTISLNSSGAPLFQRGYRKGTGDAPLNEVVAAGLILMSGWDQESNFIDIFCGSGTLPIEAALIANGIPANIARKRYSFQNWPDYDRQLWEDVHGEAPKQPRRDLDFKIIGSDIDGEMVKMARNNTKALPLGKTIEFQIKDFRDQKSPGKKGVLISNPPYGERLAGEIEDMYKETGDFFKHEMAGFDCWLLSSNLTALKRVELKPSKKIQVYNGSLSCDFRKYTIFEGSLKEFKFKYPNERRVPKRKPGKKKQR